MRKEPFERQDAARATDDPSVKAYRHHTWQPGALPIQNVERVAAIVLKFLRRVHIRPPEAEIIDVDRVRHDQERALGDQLKIRDIVVYRPAVAEQAFLRQDSTRR